MAAVGLKLSLALSVLYLLWTVTAAPVDEGSSQALQLGESIADGRGCYYNFEHYGEGDRILTNEPCLNCTCHNRMLMCYLRVCPFTKAIGQDCTVEKKPDQCCPIITCPQVPVALLTSSTTSELPPTTTALGRPDNYGCILEDNTFYADGAQVPSDPRKPCELCYCIRNHTACVMQECTLNVEGCKPVYQDGICCPVRYDCDYDEVATTPKPTIGLVTTPGGPSDCLHNGRIYHDGAMVMKDEKAPCEHCYCMRGDIVCAVQECGTPLEGTNCTPMEPKHGQCCPNYKCANETQATENEESALPSSAEKLPESSISESDENEEHESDKKSSNESSSDESQKGSQEEMGLEVSKPIADGLESSNHELEFTSTNAPEQSKVSDETLASSSQELNTKQPETPDPITTETPLQENIVQQAGDSISEATQDQDVTHIQETTHNQEKGTTLGQEAVQSQETTPTQEVVLEQEEHQEDETTPKQEVNQEQGTTHDQQETSLDNGSQTLTEETEKDQQVPNEIPESTPPQKSEPITEEPATEVARIPGEGSCLVEGQTYAHNSVIPTENPCQESCKCHSSIVTCKQKDCPPAPTQFEHCMPVTSPGSCCPTYMCDQKPSDAPEAQNQVVGTTDDTSHDDTTSVDQHNHQIDSKPATVENEDKGNSIPPVVEGIPPDNLLPGSYENGVPAGQPEENLHETDIQTTKHTGTSTDISSSNINEDEHVNSHVVHGIDAAIDGGQLESMDNKHENGNIPHSSEGITTMKSVEPVKIDDEFHEIAITHEPEPTIITDDNAAVDNEKDPQKHETATVSLGDHEMAQTTVYYTTSPRPSEEDSSHAQETIESENSGTVHSEVVETNDYVPEVITVPQEVQEILETNVPTVNPHSEENINDITSIDSNLDESKNEENLITNKPVEISTSQETEGEILTDQYQYATTQGPTGIPVDSSHSDNHNDLVQSQTDQEHTTVSQENTYSESLPQVPSATVVNNENIESHGPPVISLPSEFSDEIQNPVTEENLSQTGSPTNQDIFTEANQPSSGNLDSEKNHSPPVSDQVFIEIPTTSSPQEASINESSNDKLSETFINEVPGETNNEISHDTEVTTDSVIQTTIRPETVPDTPEISQEESEAQESNNIITSSTEKETSEDRFTIFPTKNRVDETENGGKVDENTPHETQVPTEQTIHSDVIVDESLISSGEVHAEATTAHEISVEEEAAEQVTKESGVETPTEARPQESVSYKPSEVTLSSISQEEGGSNDSSPEVIFEEITAAGMPSIESHVTEGTMHHSIDHINNLPISDTQHTTEHSEPAKEPSNVKEVQSSSQPFSPEVLSEPTIPTDKSIEEQPIGETTPGYQIVPNAEDSNNEITSIQQETRPDILPSEVASTQPPISDGSSHKETTNEEENTTAEANTESVTSQQTTINSETATKVKDENENSNQITSDSSTETNGKIDTEQNKIQNSVSDDEKNEITSPAELIPNLSEQDSQSVSSSDFSTGPPDEISHETTSITPTEIIHGVIQQEPHVEDNTETNFANQPKTEAPIDKEVIISNEEQNPSEVQTDIGDDSHKDISVQNVVNPNIEDIAVTSTPLETTQDTTVTNAEAETTHDGEVTNAPVDVTHDVAVTNEPVEITQDSAQTSEPVHATNTPIEVTNAPVETAQDGEVTNAPVETAHDAETTNAPDEIAYDTEVTNAPVETTHDGEVTNAPIETTHDGEVTNAPIETTHDTEVTNVPVETAQETDIIRAPVEEIHDTEVTNAPVETAHDAEVTNAPVETAHDAEVTNAPVESTHDAEVTNAPIETTHDTEITNAPVETTQDAEVTNSPIETAQDGELTNGPVETVHDAEVTNTPVETAHVTEVTNAPVEISHDAEVTNAPVEMTHDAEVTNAPIEITPDEEVTNGPVETAHDADVTNTPVETAHVTEVTNAPVEIPHDTEVTNAPVETAHDIEVTNAPVETAHDTEVTNAPVETAQDTRVTNEPVETTQGPEVTNVPVETLENTSVTQAPVETGQDTETTNSPVETGEGTEVPNAPVETFVDTIVTQLPIEIAQDTGVTHAPAEIAHDTEVTNAPVEISQDAEVTRAPVETVHDTIVTYPPQEISQDNTVTHAPVEKLEDSAATNAPIEIAHENSEDTYHTEEPQQPNQSEILQQEPIIETSPEHVPEEAGQVAEVTDTNKEISTEVTSEKEPLHASSEKSEVPLTDNKENIHEVPIESLPQPEQNSTPPSLTIASESSTSHEETIQEVSTESTSAHIPQENQQLPNEDSSPLVSQVTHLEHVAPPAPNSDSHILETSETEGDTSTKATEETTTDNQVTVAQNQQNIQDQKIHDEIPSHEVEMEEPGSKKPLPEEVSKVPTTQGPDLTESSLGLEGHESSSMQAEIHMNTTQHPLLETVNTEGPKSTEVHPVAEDSQTTPKETIPVTQKIETDEEAQRPEGHIMVTESSTNVPTLPVKPHEHLSSLDQPTEQSSKVQTVTHATETAILNEIPSNTHKPSHVHHEQSPSFPTWSQKPFEHHTTPEPHPPEESHYPSGFDPEYEDEEGVSYGPGTCRYGGKVYLSAQQIPRDDPCDFCFCFRSDIICLQQSCPPPIRGCYQETIKGFCCPRYECHVSMATMLNITTTTTTTTTTLPPHFFAHAYNGAAMKAGCQVKDVAYSVGERIPSTSGPCLECRCGANGQMKCDPTVCGPQEALLRQVMDAAISRRR